MVATLESQKISIIERIIALNDVEKINEIDYISSLIGNSNLIGNSKETQPMSDEELFQRIKKSKKDFEDGRTHSLAEMREIAKTWGR